MTKATKNHNHTGGQTERTPESEPKDDENEDENAERTMNGKPSGPKPTQSLNKGPRDGTPNHASKKKTGDRRTKRGRKGKMKDGEDKDQQAKRRIKKTRR
jgi:hypothetical protein